MPIMPLAKLGARMALMLGPEQAHRATVQALSLGLGPKVSPLPAADAQLLKTSLAGLNFPNPLGLAPGFDKNAEVANAVLALGFGFAEIGAVTPRPQAGNARPRVFRLSEDGAVINRYGFNNEGLAAIAARLAKRPRIGIVGANLGANKDSADPGADYVAGIEALSNLIDFFTVNVSSPNTPGLRALQSKEALQDILERVLAARDDQAAKVPVFLKIAPDLTDADKADIAEVARALKIDGLVVSNTTIIRPDSLVGQDREERGGLSGRPLFEMSTKLLAEFYGELGADVPLIGVGGVACARDAYDKILAGAQLVQLYTAMVYQGPDLASKILSELPGLLRADGFDHVSAAVGKNAH